MTHVQHLKSSESTCASPHPASSLRVENPAVSVVSSKTRSSMPRLGRDPIRELGSFTAMLVNGSAVGVAVLALVKLIGMTNGVWG